jgi:hypothetical protein
MRTSLPLLVAFVAALAACKSKPSNAPADIGWTGNRPPEKLIEGPVVRPPANDISETQRLEWFDAQRPRYETVETERVTWRDMEPYHVERHSDPCWLWAIPLSLSFGYASGGHGHSGWGVGATWGWNGWH